jgi:hypothetical protein
MSQAMRKPCFEGSTEDCLSPDECQASRYSQHSDPDCGWLEKGGTWNNCKSGRLDEAYAAWRHHTTTRVCSKCHGTGRVKK